MGENICNKATDNRLVSKIYKQLMPTQYQKDTQPNRKNGRRPKQEFLQDIKMANKHMKRCSTLVMQIKTTVRYHLVKQP